MTRIEWTNKTWNPVTGCTKISEGCANCYAERMARRLAGRYGYPADDPFRVTLHPNRLDQPLRWRKPRRVFVCSMGDLFHDGVPFEFAEEVMRRIYWLGEHTFQVLTKRPRRMYQFMSWWSGRHCIDPDDSDLPYDNLWLGVTAENQRTADERIPILLDTPAAVRFVSVEPMLGPVDLSEYVRGWDVEPRHVCGGDERICHQRCPEAEQVQCDALDWAIIGCESGPGRRPMQLEWALDLVRQCKHAGVPVFVKQIEIGGRVSHNPDEWPEELRVREWPL